MFMMGFSAPIFAQVSPPPSPPTQYQVCEGTFALCTTAICSGTAQDQNVDCICTVNKGYSAGGQECRAPAVTPQGTQIYSRFFPIGSYQPCTNPPSASSPWAWCLDKQCLIDKDNPTIAHCQCGNVTTASYSGLPSFPYIIVTGQVTSTLCQNGINYSSATVSDATNINNAFNEYLKKNNPYPLSTPTALQLK